jgi:glycosyltransferase involved in cell wall biosynthesis
MRIVHVTSVHEAGDIRIFRKLAVSAAREGHEVTVLALGTEDARSYQDGVTQVVFRVPRVRFWRLTIAAPWLVWKASSFPADLYHFHDPELVPWFLLLALQNRRVVMDVHEDLPAEVLEKAWIPLPLRKIVSAVSEAMVRLASRALHGTVTASAELADKFLNEAGPVRVVAANNYPLINERVLGSDRAAARYHSGKVLVLGGVTYARAANVVIAALEQLQDLDVSFTVAGNHNDPALLASLQATNAWRRVEYLGKVSRERVDVLMNECAVSINVFADYPNHHDIRSNRLFEAMEAGLPVIVSDFPRWRAFVEQFKCGIAVKETDASSIAAAVRAFISDPALAKSMGSAGQRAIRDKLSWESQYSGVDRLYARIYTTAFVPRAK